MATSAVPNAITQLLAILRARPELQPGVEGPDSPPGVQVIDGPPTDDISRDDLIAVGWSFDGDQAVEIAQDFNAAGARTRNENFAITGVIDVWSGDDSVAAARDRVFELFGVLEMAVRASGSNPDAPNLNGAVLWAHITRGVLRQSYTDQGVRAGLAFTVTCHARI
ncbi:hypothetical protein [Streptomyces graminilatus]|uniref:hypothetical protein n=1 Tax=Streptomyces graminilatus TaxID=1464070 RepID=UPI0006E15056|nr:hypothetical protein [Streptomyces graminilatus]